MPSKTKFLTKQKISEKTGFWKTIIIDIIQRWSERKPVVVLCTLYRPVINSFILFKMTITERVNRLWKSNVGSDRKSHAQFV